MTMASADKCYPDYLNPFGSDDEGEDGEEEQLVNNKCNNTRPADEYPDYLSPFDEIDEQEAGHTSTANKTSPLDDYDDSLNPFGDDDSPDLQPAASQPANHTSAQQQQQQQQMPDDIEDLGEGNPFAEDLEEVKRETKQTPIAACDTSHKQLPSVEVETFNNGETSSKAIATSSQETLDKPPVPLPRTKSLLKKELAAQRLKQQLQQQLNKVETSNHHAIRSPQLARSNDSVLEEEGER